MILPTRRARKVGPKDMDWLMSQAIPEPNSGCWLWMRSTNSEDYGQTQFEGKLHAAHRISYRLSGREIPSGSHVDHLCRVHCCINPDHLEAVSHSENIRRGYAAKHLPRKKPRHSACLRGHSYDDPTNTYIDTDGMQHCRKCRAAQARAFRARRKATP